MPRARDAATGVVLAERLRPAHTHWTRLRGLLGTRVLAPGDGLWIKPCKQVHMIGMRYAIDVVFLDDAQRVVRTIEGLSPGRISPKIKDATSVLELPVGTLASSGLAVGACIEILGSPHDAVKDTRRTSVGGRPWMRGLAWMLAFIVATSALVLLARTHIRWEKPCPDYVCFWAAGTLLAAGHSPYDFAMLGTIQREHGWDKATDGQGFYDFLPYYYPPSILWPVAALLVPLGFSTARIAWLVINSELFLLAGYLMRHAVARVPRAVPVLLVPLFALSVLCALVGQLTALILFMMAAAWRLLQRGWDRTAGWVLAWMSVKPQLSTVLLVALLVWLVRQRRWYAVQGFVTGSLCLLAVSTWWVPSWPLDIIRAVVHTPVVTMTFPWVGTTWLLVLRSLGVEWWLVWPFYLLLALPFGGAVLRAALQRSSSIDDIFALGILGAFFLAPTARPYDLPILLIPLLVVLGQRMRAFARPLLVAVLAVVPYVQLLFWAPSHRNVPVHVWFFWIPLLLASLWFGSRRRALLVTPGGIESSPPLKKGDQGGFSSPAPSSDAVFEVGPCQNPPSPLFQRGVIARASWY